MADGDGAYGNVTATNTHSHHISQPSYNPNTSDFITYIKNKLRIQDHQIFITYDQAMSNSPKECGQEVAYALCGKLNEWMCVLDQEEHQVSNTNT